MKHGLSVFFVLILAGCGSSQVTGVTSATPVDTTGSGCSAAPIYKGIKGSTTTTARGIYSDVEMIPGTTRPAVAYYDLSSLTIKLSYFDGVDYQVEIISGDTTGAGASTHIRLSFFSDGRPIVAWTTGSTTVQAAIRSAALSSTGSWTASVIDTYTGGQTRALEMKVNPLDEVLVLYITHGATNPRARVLFCGASCASPAGFTGMISTESVEGANVGTNQMATGVAWCRVDAAGTDYYPAVTYGGTAQFRYGVCQQSNLTSCLAAASWTKQNVAAMANGVTTKLVIDSTVVGDVPKVVGKTAAGLVPYVMNAATACTAAPTAFTAGAAIGGANSGNAWAKVLKDSGGKFHIVANETTTSVRYYNSQTTTLNGAWNAAGTVNTVTLPAVTGNRGGGAIDSTSGVVYASYGSNAVPYQLYLGKVNDISVASNLATFTNDFPDSNGNIMLTTTGLPIKNLAVAKTSSGQPAAAFIDFSVGALANATLRYGYNSGSGWAFQTIPTGTNPRFPSLAFDHLNRPWVSYFDDADDRFYLAYNSSATGVGAWNTVQMPLVTTGTYTLPAANETALAMYYSSGVASPVLFVLDNNNTTRGVRSGMYTLSTGLWSNLNVATPVIAMGASGGRDLTVDQDVSGNIVFSYYDLTNTLLNYGYTANGGSTFVTNAAVAPITHGLGASIKINPTTSRPAIAYYDLTNNRVYYSSCTSSLTGCATAGWGNALELEASAGVSAMTTTTSNMMRTGIEYNSAGSAQVQFVSGQGSYGSLHQCVITSAGAKSCSIVESGKNGNFVGANAVNYAIAGWAVGLVRTASNYLASLFIGPGGWLYSMDCNN